VGELLSGQDVHSLQLKSYLHSAPQKFMQNFLSSSLLSKNIKIKICRNLILPVVLYGCEIWPLTVKEVQKLRVLESTVLRRMFGPKRDKVTGEWRRLHNEEVNDLHFLLNIIQVIKSVRMRWSEQVVWWGREEVNTGLCWGILREREHLEDLGVD